MGKHDAPAKSRKSFADSLQRQSRPGRHDAKKPQPPELEATEIEAQTPEAAEDVRVYESAKPAVQTPEKEERTRVFQPLFPNEAPEEQKPASEPAPVADEAPSEEEAAPIKRSQRRQAEQKKSFSFDVSGILGAVAAFFVKLGGLLRSYASDQRREHEFNVKNIALVAASALLFFVVALLKLSPWLKSLLFLLPLLLVGYETLYDAFTELVSGDYFGREVLISLSAVGCCCLGQFRVAVFLLLLFRVGVLIEAYVLSERKRLSSELNALRSVKARVETDGLMELRDAAQVQVGEVIVVEPGETVALDGLILDGLTDLDLKKLTGTEGTVNAGPGSLVYAGSVNLTKPLRVQVSDRFEDCFAVRALRTAERGAQTLPRSAQSLRVAVGAIQPVLAVLAPVLGLLLAIITGAWRVWIGRWLLLWAVDGAISFDLAVSSAYYVGLCRSALRGEIFRDASALERYAVSQTFALSKTGTVMEGDFEVSEVHSDRYTEKDLLVIAALCEGSSQHAIARALRKACGIGVIQRDDVKVLEETPGRGISAIFSRRHVYVGNASLLLEHGISFEPPASNGMVIHVAVDNEYAGYIVLNDRMRENAFDAIEELRVLGVKSAVMLTGDLRSAARPIASALSFDMVKCELDGAGKASALEYLLESKGSRAAVSYVSHDEDELPLLKKADVGVFFHALGSRKAIEQADLSILGEDIEALGRTLRLAQRSRLIAWINLLGLVGVQLLLAILGLVGAMNIWLAVLLETLAMTAAYFNAFRAR